MNQTHVECIHFKLPLLNPGSVFLHHNAVSQHHHRHRCTWWPSKHEAMRSSSVILFDSTVAHGLGFAHSLAGDFKGDSLVFCNTLLVCAQIWLDLLPHLLFGVQLFVRLTCTKAIAGIRNCVPFTPITHTGFMIICFMNFQGCDAWTTDVLLSYNCTKPHVIIFCSHPACTDNICTS